MLKKGKYLLMAGVLGVLLCGCQTKPAETTTEETEETEISFGEVTEPSGEESTVEPENSKEQASSMELASSLEPESSMELASSLEQESSMELDSSLEPENSEETESETEMKAEEFQVTDFDPVKKMFAVNAVNVRKGPGTGYEAFSFLRAGQEVQVTGRADTGWFRIQLGEETGYVSHHYLSGTAAEPVEKPETEPEKQAPGQPEKAPVAVQAPAGVIMVGDSRCVQMQEAVGGGGCSWICENSKEYTWFTEKAIPRFDEYVGKGTKVVINMGVNDPEHYSQYVETVNAKAAEWAQRGASTYFVSVNPVWENPYTTQEQVDTFNANVPGMLSGVKWIDTSGWLVQNGYKLKDGLHYDDDTYVNIFNLIMGSI